MPDVRHDTASAWRDNACIFEMSKVAILSLAGRARPTAVTTISLENCAQIRKEVDVSEDKAQKRSQCN
jgi:hypothetical protein